MRVITATALLLATMVCLRASASCFEKDIALSDVPLGVLTAARNAVEGLDIVEAELIGKDDAVVYELEGTVGDSEYEVRVSPSGDVLGIEEEDD